jgi:hypothetical protein
VAKSRFSKARAAPASFFDPVPLDDDDPRDGPFGPDEGPDIPLKEPEKPPPPYANFESNRYRLFAAIMLCAYSVEEYLMRADLFGLATASPLQRAICRVLSGYPLDGSRNPVNEWSPALERILAQTVDDDTRGRDDAILELKNGYDDRLAIVGEDLTSYPGVLEAFGGTAPCEGVRELMVVAAIRCAKTLIAGAALAQRTMIANLTGLRPGETARAGVISWRVDLANTCFEFMTGAFESSPLLRTQVLEAPKWFPGAPKNVLRVYNRVSDRNVDILTLAANRGGASALSKWYVGFVVDEAARMLADFQDGVINYTDIRRAVFQRILPDGFYLAITSPWLSVGPIYEAQKRLGVHEQDGLCVAWAPGWVMNPVTWDEEACRRARAADPESYLTDVEARFAHTDELALAHALVLGNQKVRVAALTDEPVAYADVAVLDAGLRKDGVALALAGMHKGKRVLLVYREWLGWADTPLDMRVVAHAVALWLRRYNLTSVLVDALSCESFGELLEHEDGLSVAPWEATAREFAALAGRLEHHMKLGEVFLPDDQRVRDDLSSVRRLTSTTGEVSVAFPLSTSLRASTSSRAVLYAMGQLYRVAPEDTPEVMTEEKRMRDSLLRRMRRQADPLGERDAIVDAALERYDAMGAF